MTLRTDEQSSLSSGLDSYVSPEHSSRFLPSSNVAHESVPSEIWSEVFKWTQRLYEPFVFYGPSHEPANFRSYGAVCSNWRSIMLQTAGLWARVKLHPPCKPPAFAEALTAWLERSKKHPLCVIIDGENLDDTNFELFFECVGILLQHGYRWKELYLRINFGEEDPNWKKFWPSVLSDAPILEKCVLTLRGHLSPLIVSAPNLREVKMILFDDTRGVHINLLPCFSLTHLEIWHKDQITTEEQVDYLKACPLLKTFTVRSGSIRNSGELYPFQVVHTTIQRITIWGGRLHLLSGLVAPFLSRLSIKNMHYIPVMDFASILSLVRNTTTLRELAFSEPYNIFAGFKNVHHIESLRLSGTYQNVMDFNGCIGTLRDPSVLPGLRRLMVDIRFASTGRLVVRDVDQNRNLCYSFREGLLQLCQERLQVQSGNGSGLQQIDIDILASSEDTGAYQTEVEIILDMKNLGIEGLSVVAKEPEPLGFKRVLK